jgi:NADH-quinone oxidoreductase subunit N
VARERVSEHGDDLRSFENLGTTAPWLAGAMTIAMLSLAGFPATAGFIGKFYLIDASVAGDYTWLGIMIVIGSMLSLAYYLRVLAVMWMGQLEVDLPTTPARTAKPVAGWSPEADARAQPEVLLVALLAAAATIFFGIWPDPLFDLARDVGSSLSGLG